MTRTNIRKEIEEIQFHNEQKEREQRAKEIGDQEYYFEDKRVRELLKRAGGNIPISSSSELISQ